MIYVTWSAQVSNKEEMGLYLPLHTDAMQPYHKKKKHCLRITRTVFRLNDNLNCNMMPSFFFFFGVPTFHAKFIKMGKSSPHVQRMDHRGYTEQVAPL